MTKKTTLFIAGMLLIAFISQAQQNYTHTVSNNTYQDISNPVYISDTASITDSYYLDIDFLFPVFGAFSNFKVDAANQNPGAYISRGGYLAIIESPGFDHTHVFAPYFNDNLIRRDATSSLAVKLSGAAGNRLLQFQWKNMGIKNHLNSEYVNFQVWFNEAEKSVSYHYGPSNFTASPNDVGIINFFRSTNDAVPVFTTALNLTGDAALPASLTVAHPTSYTDMQGVTNFAPAGTVITFKAATTGIQNSSALSTSIVYPNPTNGLLTLQTSGEVSGIEIYDLQGALVFKDEEITNINTIDLKSKAPGIYILKLLSGTEIIATQKIIKN